MSRSRGADDQSLLIFIQNPDGHRQHVERFGDEFRGLYAQVGLILDASQPLRARCPDPGRVMLRLAEMPDDKYVKSLSCAVGQKQHSQAGYSQKNDKGLKLENLTSAKALRHLRQNADD